MIFYLVLHSFKKNHEINQNENNEIYLLCFFKVSFNIFHEKIIITYFVHL